MTEDKNFQTCYTTVMSVMKQSNPMLKVMPPANKVLPSFKAEVIPNMTQPIHLKPDFPGDVTVAELNRLISSNNSLPLPFFFLSNQ